MRPRLQVQDDHQRLRLRLWWARLMLSMCPVRVQRKSEGAMLRGRELTEVFAWVWGGGTCLMAGAGHVAAGGPTDRQAARARHSARGEVAPARHGVA